MGRPTAGRARLDAVGTVMGPHYVERALLAEREEFALTDVLGHATDPETVPDVERAAAADALVGAARSAGLLVVGRTGR
ncbi:hypothetical protein [Kitasatospora sp. NPDC056531]|uniref:hypothetical protein n=1 Tax=Kitasatospora sp. NPDC056531 TaxID=3345856 RepID=UPI0036830053